jgi:hypothetical protein
MLLKPLALGPHTRRLIVPVGEMVARRVVP